jgi:hypothetical protein
MTDKFVHGTRERSFGKATGKMPDLSKGSNPRPKQKKKELDFIPTPISPEKREALDKMRIAKANLEREEIKLKLIEADEREQEREAHRRGFRSHSEFLLFKEKQGIEDAKREQANKDRLAQRAEEIEAGRRRRGGLTIKDYCAKHDITSTSAEFKRRMATIGFRDEWIENGKWIVDNSISPNDTRSIRSYEKRGDIYSLRALQENKN